jgi:molybdenum cofactor sulfurtransferase
MPAISPTLEGDKIRAFIPADYVKRRKPWEEEMRKQSTTFNHGVPGDLKMREGEDGGSVSKASTPSFRARKFGRSVVNLLKSNRSNVNINFADQRYEIQ